MDGRLVMQDGAAEPRGGGAVHHDRRAGHERAPGRDARLVKPRNAQRGKSVFSRQRDLSLNLVSHDTQISENAGMETPGSPSLWV